MRDLGSPSPRFAYLEIATLFGRDGDEALISYFSNLGFGQATDTYIPPGMYPGWRSTDMRRGSFRVLITGHRSGSGLYPRVLHSGPHVSAVAFVTGDRAFTLNRAQEAGLNILQRHAKLGDGSVYSTIEGPGGMNYIFTDGTGWGTDDGQLGTGSLDHIAVVTTRPGSRKVIDTHEALFGAGTWHPMPLTRLPNGEAIGSGFIRAGGVRVTIVWPVGERGCRQLTGFRAVTGGDGVQHAALRVDGRIIPEVDEGRRLGAGFRDAPAAYYDVLEQRLGHPIPDLGDLKRTGVLADDDEYVDLEGRPHGIRQIFARPFGASDWGPFIELIDRGFGGETFGGRNVRALAESIELDSLRGGRQAVS